MFTIKGKVTDILSPVVGTSSKGDWHKFEYVVLYEEGEYPKSICLTAFNKTDLYEKLQIDQVVSVNFAIDCRAYQERFYNSLMTIKCDIQSTIPEGRREAQRKDAQKKVADAHTHNPKDYKNVDDDDSNDLPF